MRKIKLRAKSIGELLCEFLYDEFKLPHLSQFGKIRIRLCGILLHAFTARRGATPMMFGL